MRLGGMVIHGNNVETIQACLESLAAVCDDVVAVDCGATDGSAQLAERFGRRVALPWHGYGAARAAAASALRGCDYLLYLDSDESLSPESIELLRSWKTSGPTEPGYRLNIHDWVELGGKRFLFREEKHIRLFRADSATWSPRMIVHESVGLKGTPVLGATVEHRFLNSLAVRRAKEERYALLWAVQMSASPKRAKNAWLQRFAHFVRGAIWKGALFRGGWLGIQVAWWVSRYHARKYAYLRRVRGGDFAALREAYERGAAAEVFRIVEETIPL